MIPTRCNSYKGIDTTILAQNLYSTSTTHFTRTHTTVRALKLACYGFERKPELVNKKSTL